MHGLDEVIAVGDRQQKQGQDRHEACHNGDGRRNGVQDLGLAHERDKGSRLTGALSPGKGGSEQDAEKAGGNRSRRRVDEGGNGEPGQDAVFDLFKFRLDRPLLPWMPAGKIFKTPVPEKNRISNGRDPRQNVHVIEPGRNPLQTGKKPGLKQHSEAADNRRKGAVTEDLFESWGMGPVVEPGIPEPPEIGKCGRHESGMAGRELERLDRKQSKGPGESSQSVQKIPGGLGPVSSCPEEAFPSSSGDPHPDPAFPPVCGA